MNTRPLSLEIYTRAYAATSEPAEHVTGLARELVTTGVAAEYDVVSWPSVVQTTTDSEVLRRYREFELWADETGVDIDAAFRRCTEDNWMTGEHREKLFTPLVCVAVRQDGDLVAVLPCCVDGDDNVSVLDYLDALTRGEDPLGTLGNGDGDRRVAVAK